MKKLLLLIGLLLISLCAGGCWRQYTSSAPPLYQQFSSVRTPLDAKYPGTATLMNAPATDPALNNLRDELRP
jgi:hypothetical protein